MDNRGGQGRRDNWKQDKRNKHKKWGKQGGGQQQPDFSHSLGKGQILTGLLVTCTGKNEKMAVQDIYKILNEYAEELAPEVFEEVEEPVLPKRAPPSPSKDEDGDGLADRDRDEVAHKPRPKRVRHFQQMRMRAKGIIFIIMNESMLKKVSPFALSKKILDSIEENKSLLTRYCSRIYPVEYTLDANLELFQQHAKILVEKHFPALEEGKSLTWSFRFKCRSNSKFTRNMFLTEVLGLIPSSYMYLEYHGNVEFFVDITQHTMCMTVLSPYSDHRYYSFQKCVEVSKPVQKGNSDKGYDEEDSGSQDDQDGDSEEGEKDHQPGAKGDGSAQPEEGKDSEGGAHPAEHVVTKSGGKTPAQPGPSDGGAHAGRKGSVESEKSDIDLI